MRDVEMELWVDGDTEPGDRAAFTVLTAEQPEVNFAGECAANNDKRNVYRDWTLANHYQLGPQEFNDEDSPFDDRYGWGTEASARIWPADFDYPSVSLKLERDVEFHDWIGNGTSTIATGSFSSSIPPGNDTGPTDARDDDPSPDDNLYDIDAPGLAVPIAPVDEVRRTRNNFRVWVTVESAAWGEVRCSLVREYYIAFSMRQVDAPSGRHWVDVYPPDVSGDLAAGYGTTKLTWNLQ